MRVNRSSPASATHAAGAMPAAPDLRGFCAAPWTEGVLKADGAFMVCCRNGTTFGNWVRDGLEGCWHAPDLATFRGTILAGRFPDDSCRNCLANGTARSLAADLGAPFARHGGVLVAQLGPLPELAAFQRLLPLRRADATTPGVLQAYRALLGRIRLLLAPSPPTALALDKLEVIGNVVAAFLQGDVQPSEPAPYRQVSLSDRCNARCIQCPGLYAGHLAAGAVLPDEHLAGAFASGRSIVDFFMNGAEFLLYPGWKQVAAQLASQGVQLSMSTNGILLTPATIAHLVDGHLAATINVSFDGAERETVESTRVNVKFERLCAHLAYLIEYAETRQPRLDVSVSFVLMRRNFREFGALVRLVDHLRAGRRAPRVAVFCQGLETYDLPAYNEFVAREHHANVPVEELTASFHDALSASRETGIPVFAFYSHPLEQFVAQGCPFPPLVRRAVPAPAVGASA